MKVLLIKDVKGLGRAGELREVKEGYGQNFLIAKGLAKAATTEVLRKFESDKRREAEELRFELANLEKLKEQLAATTVKIKKSVGANGALFGGVTKEEIAAALKEQKNIQIDKKAIECELIKSLGSHEVGLRLGHSLHAVFYIQVEAL